MDVLKCNIDEFILSEDSQSPPKDKLNTPEKIKNIKDVYSHMLPERLRSLGFRSHHVITPFRKLSHVVVDTSVILNALGVDPEVSPFVRYLWNTQELCIPQKVLEELEHSDKEKVKQNRFTWKNLTVLKEGNNPQ